MNASPGRELYIYWKVAQSQREAARTAARLLQAMLQQRHPLLVARVLEREAAATHSTLMETYQCPGGVTPALAADIESCAAACLAAAGLVDVQRHVECFAGLQDTASDRLL